jgi:uncharacterized membrane protein YdbT with pleckstrin-like domain
MNKMENELEFVHKRGSILILFEKLTQLPLLIATILFSIYAGAAMDFQLVFAAGFIAISPVLQLVRFLFTYYTIAEEQLIVESGIWNKKQVSIPLRSITTVDLTQNILYQVFKTYKIKVDNGSQSKDSANRAEVQFALNAQLAFQFKKLVEVDLAAKAEGKTDLSGLHKGLEFSESDTSPNEKKEKEPLAVITTSPLEFLQLGLLESKLVYIISVLPVLSGIAYFASSLGFDPGESNLIKNALALLDAYPLVPVLLITAVVLFFIGLVFSVFRAIMTFFGFQLTADSAKIHIEYGLLTKRKYTLQKDKISGILMKQNMLMRLFHRYQLEVLVIGYGDKSDEEVKQKPILFPLADKQKIKEIVETIMPEFKGDYYEAAPSGTPSRWKAFRYFFYQTGFVLTTLLLLASVVFAFRFDALKYTWYLSDMVKIGIISSFRYAPLFLAIPLEIVTIGSILLQFFNTRVIPGKKLTAIYSGGYHRTVTVLKTSCVESITAIASRWKQRRGFASIRLGYVAPLQSSKTIVKNRGIEEFEQLEAFLDM